MAYKRMPFVCSNVGSTFQRAMDTTFKGLMYKRVLVYLDGISVFSKDANAHLLHLKQVFERCREYGISLNQKLCIFVVHKGKERLPSLPLQRVQVEHPFMRWGIDFIGPINPLSSVGYRWVLIATDYFIRWTKAIALKDSNEHVVLNFYDDLVTRFGVPDSIISDNALAFLGLRVTDWAIKNGIHFNTSSNYYPQGNCLAESTNKNLIRIIKRTMEENLRVWYTSLKYALWQDGITPKCSIGNSPCVLFYGKEARLSIFVELPSLDIRHQLEMLEEEDPMEVQYAQLLESDE
ncbi:uncharacterized protein LOC131874433 [Cryptomeria japonica]|uniref:uncharacterized protein LOC131874433 n=1 Tax=Cryptomeria japonica TaxID=3369 RepID=UPI0027DA24AE|nr:uncharacterized protein LOC131874433 [Cryptomeria japonica]